MSWEDFCKCSINSIGKSTHTSSSVVFQYEILVKTNGNFVFYYMPFILLSLKLKNDDAKQNVQRLSIPRVDFVFQCTG